MNYYLPRTRARIQFNTSYIVDWTTVAPSSPTDHAYFERYYNLQQTGVGLCGIDTDFYANSPIVSSSGTHRIIITITARTRSTDLRAPTTWCACCIFSWWCYIEWVVCCRDDVVGRQSERGGRDTNLEFCLRIGLWHSELFDLYSDTYTATQATQGCLVFNVVIKTNYVGLDSDPFYVFNNAPSSIEDAGVLTHRNPDPPDAGYISSRQFRVRNSCNEVMNWVTVNESFSNDQYGPLWGGGASTSAMTWRLSVWAGGYFDASGWFYDDMWEFQGDGKKPQPMSPGTNNFDESANSQITIHSQWFKAGPASSGDGVLVRAATQSHYLDHGNQE